MADEMDPVDFNEYMVRPRLDAKARKQSMWMAEQISLADSVSVPIINRLLKSPRASFCVDRW